MPENVCLISSFVKRITLYVGAFHQKIGDEDFTDIYNITTNQEEAEESLKRIEEEARSLFKMICKEKTLTSIRFESKTGEDFIDAFYVERLVIIRKD